jgi:hypothetical protein
MLITMLFVIATIGGFIYINMYLMFDLYNVTIAMKPGATGMTPDSCSYYYCGQSANYYAHNRAAYDKCNAINCGGLCNTTNNVSTPNTMTTTDAIPFDCNTPTFLPLSFYYSCYSNCNGTNLVTNNVAPPQLYVVFIVGCVAGCFFGVAILISLVYGVLGGCCCGALGLSCGERLALFVNFFCPSAKYYAFRERNDWEDIRISFKWMLWIDIIVTAFVAIALAGYIYLAIYQAFLFYEYLVTYGVALVLLTYIGNLHRNYIELTTFQDRLENLRSR